MYVIGQKSWNASAPLERIEMPTPEPGPRDVRVAVHAISVNPVDWKMRSSGPLRVAARLIRPFRGPRGPVVVGVDFAGVIEAVGTQVEGLAPGTRVVGATNFSRGQHGSYGDTVVVRADQVCPIPDAMAFDVASALPVAGVTAWRAIDDVGRLTDTRKVLVVGASGGVGQFATQIAKRVLGSPLVAGVCSGKNADLVRGLGADVILDYNEGDPFAAARAHGPFDVVVDCVGSYSPRACRSVLSRRGRHVMVAGDGGKAMLQVIVPPFRSRAILGRADGVRLAPLVDAVATGKVTVNIAERLPLADVEAAHRKSQTGRLTGKIILLPR